MTQVMRKGEHMAGQCSLMSVRYFSTSDIDIRDLNVINMVK